MPLDKVRKAAFDKLNGLRPEVKARKKAWAKNNPDKIRAFNRANRYGISATAQKELLEAQNYCCGICAQPLNDRMHCDHDHETGKVRGFLCPACNRGLGAFRDSTTILEAAIRYLVTSRL